MPDVSEQIKALERQADETLDDLYQTMGSSAPSQGLSSGVFETCIKALILQMRANRIALTDALEQHALDSA